MNDYVDTLMWVRHNMPNENALALEHFTTANPHWRGANWEDCLDVLLDSDSHLELTEPLYEEFDALDIGVRLQLVCPIAVTLLWAKQLDNHEDVTGAVTAWEILAVLERFHD